MKRFIRLLACLICACAASAAVAAAPPAPGPTVYVQVWLGALNTDDQSWKVNDPTSGDSAAGDLGTLPFGGGAGQLLWGSGVWQIGYEGGGVGTWKTGTTDFRGASNGGTSVNVSFENRFLMLGVFMGGVVAANLGHNARIYVAGGPSLTWARLEDDGNGNQSTQSDVIVLDGAENDVSFVAYGRAGIEFVLDNGFAFGASVRYADDEFDFGAGGKLKFDEPMWLLTLGARL